MEGHLLLAAGPVLRALGVEYHWVPETQAVRIESRRGPAVLRVNSRRASIGDEDVILLMPVIRLEGEVLASASLLARLTGTVAEMSPDGKMVNFDSLEACLQGASRRYAQPVKAFTVLVSPLL
jgi:hypothetical protein